MHEHSYHVDLFLYANEKTEESKMNVGSDLRPSFCYWCKWLEESIKISGKSRSLEINQAKIKTHFSISLLPSHFIKSRLWYICFTSRSFINVT